MGFSVYWTRIPTDTTTLKKFAKDLRRVIRYSHLVEAEDYIQLKDIEDRCETFAASVSGTQFRYSEGHCKTGRTEFTFDVMAAIVLMSHYKMVTDFSNDDENEFRWEDTRRHIMNFLPELDLGKSVQDLEIKNLKARIENLEQKLFDARLFAEKILSVTKL